MKCVVVLLLVLLCCSVKSAKQEDSSDNVHKVATERKRPLSVLLMSSYFVGHLVSLVAVGEELVSRGHNVTLFTTEIRGSNVVPQLPERLGIKFLSAGVEALSRQEYEAEFSKAREKNVLETASLLINMSAQHLLQMRIGADSCLLSKDWDILLVDNAVITVGRYFAEKWERKMIVNMPVTPFFPALLPSYPFPYFYLPDNMTFPHRLINTVVYFPLYKVFMWYAWRAMVATDEVVANRLDGIDGFADIGLENPVICNTAFGMEYPRPLLPMIHFVGPGIMKSPPPIEDCLQQWLNEKTEMKVVYISMGSAAILTPQMGKAIIDGILATDYGVVWSLRETNRDILEGVQLDESRFYISKWVSQQAVLQHKAVAMAVLHGGLNGVQEAMYYRVPVIAIPFGMDQGMVSSKLYRQGLGIEITSSELSAERVTSSIKAIETGDYRQRVEKLSQIFQFAGGSKAAADLVEFYADVGYDHLVPAFHKYKWSWVQYYNVDVYALLAGILLLVIFISCRVMRCLYKKCCHCGGKVKAD